ncbi:MAG: hypothetical protein OHK0022_01430 [Roseiflexaceae bacterium]
MTTTPWREVSPGMRRMLYAASLLVLSVGIPLFLLTEQTDIYFSWTIKNPLTAAFLGAAYWSSCALEFMAARERWWTRARIAVPAVLIFTALTLVVTLLHIEVFHFNSPQFITVAGTWVWLAVYAIVPPLMLVLLLRQLRVPGQDEPRGTPLALWARAVLGINATVMLLLGVALMLAPLAAAPLWPWQLTALTARAIGAWLIGLGIAAAQAAWEGDLGRARVMLISAVLFSVLQLIALARYPAAFAWTSPQGVLYLVFLVDLLVVGGYGWYAARSAVAQSRAVPA